MGSVAAGRADNTPQIVMATDVASPSRPALVAVFVTVVAFQAAFVAMQRATGPDAAMVWARILCAAALFLGSAVYQFVVVALDAGRRQRIAAALSWVVALQLSVLALITPYGPSGVRTWTWGVFLTLHQSAQWIYALYFLAVLTAIGLAIRSRASASTPGGERSRFRLFLAALAVGSLALIDLLPAYGVNVRPLGWAALLAALTIAGVAVVKYGLPDAPYPVSADEVINSMRDLLVVTDREGVIRFANQAASSFLAGDKQDLIGRRLEDLFVPDEPGAGPAGTSMHDRESTFRTAMGQPIELSLSYSALATRDGEDGAVVIGRDLRDRKRYEWEARRAVTLLQSTLDSTADGILVIMQDGRILTWNQRFADMWGVPAGLLESHDDSGLIGRIVQEVVDPGAFLDNLAALSNRPDEKSLHIIRLKDGRRFELYSIGRRLDDQTVRVWSFRDVTARLDAEEQIQFQAYHDALTHLPNRRLFVQRLETALESARRAGSRLAVLFIDLDHFKSINDTLGHDVADGLLVEIGQRLRSCVGENDTVARHGGDEFTVLLPALNRSEDAARVAEKILEKVVAPVVIGSASMEISASIGIAVFPDAGADIEALLRNADDAMYRAKAAGRNNYQFAESR